MIPLWVKNRGEQITDSATFRWLAQDAGSGAVDLTLLKGSGSATFTRAGATATTVLSTGLVSSTIAANTARSYYDPTTLVYLGYLAEEARTNLCLQSEALNVTWGTTDVTPGGSITGPNGATVTVNKLQEGTATSSHSITQSIAKAASAIAYSCSVWLKAGERTRARVILGNGATTAYHSAFIDLSNGTTDNIATVGFTSASTSVVTYPNGWYRLILNATSDTDTAIRVSIFNVTTGTTTNYTGVSNNGIYAWGVQLEAGSFSTSYIPTAAATSTRAADVMTFPYAGNANTAIGSAFCRCSTFWNSASGNRVLIALGANGYPLWQQSNTPTRSEIYDGTTTVSKTGLTSAYLTEVKRASTWGGSVMSATGDSATPATGAFDGTLDTTSVQIGALTGLSNWCGTIRDIRIWQRVLSDSEVQAL